jgi:hypothetical protein
MHSHPTAQQSQDRRLINPSLQEAILAVGADLADRGAGGQ